MASKLPAAPLYRPVGPGPELLLYAGELVLQIGGAPHLVPGQIELELHPRTALFAHFAGPPGQLAQIPFADGGEVDLSVPGGASLAPPARSVLPQRQGKEPWVEQRSGIAVVAAGELSTAMRLLYHLSSSVQLPRFLLGDPSGPDVSFTLGHWKLRLVPAVNAAPGAPARDERDFAAVVEAIPGEHSLDLAAVERLGNRLFVLLSFLSGREVGVGPVCALDPSGEVVWAQWGPPRLRAGMAAAPWCPPHLVAQALPALADGLARLEDDEALEAVLGRAIEMLLFADSPEIVDARVITACAGLELLSWALLRRSGWLDSDSVSRLKAGSAVRLLCRWAGIDPRLPDGFDALEARRRRLNQNEAAGPELLFGIRNDVVHPPRKLDDPAWPSGDELVECWQLATWYLQLVLLRALGYEGAYWSRLRLGRSEMDVELVPWVS